VETGDEMRYIFACDEHGNTGWPRGTKKFVFGGFAIEQGAIQGAISKWDEIKLHLCGTNRVELKWKHFFQYPHQNRENNPLISKNTADCREH
jgi:hypothetical protein